MQRQAMGVALHNCLTFLFLELLHSKFDSHDAGVITGIFFVFFPRGQAAVDHDT
ncbi:hypothetical protein ACWA06_00185 [Serratia rhizosphaerae]|uniref:hypothetical protein n=1 Tax=Serratia sp. JUb9 TaxID=2724469 RepID=UPI00155875E2|nr:hypothetical protein [Serratia sp. JUb9]MBU3892315.1 hypothetical protein [Serratia rubidaea]MCA4823981.1 hypothetical protein [Serratia rubidaea]QNK30520.1 hypothetical protein HF675_12720 [Serratia sp. JUb9]